MKDARSHFALWIVLAPAYALAVILLWWLFGQRPPMTLHQFGPITLEPVSSYEEAKAKAVTAVKSDQKIYIWEEWCLHQATPGDVSRVWINGVVHTLPQRQTIGAEGCHEKSFAIRAPHTVETMEFALVKSITYHSNPLKEHVVRYPEITITVTP